MPQRPFFCVLVSIASEINYLTISDMCFESSFHDQLHDGVGSGVKKMVLFSYKYGQNCEKIRKLPF